MLTFSISRDAGRSRNLCPAFFEAQEMLTLSIREDDMADGFAPLAFTADIEAETAAVWDKVKHHVTPMEWRLHAPLISEINRIKREKNALANAEKQQKQAQADAEPYKKKNAAVPPGVQRRAEQADQAVAGSKKAIDDVEAEIGQINAKFDATLKRYRELAAANAAK